MSPSPSLEDIALHITAGFTALLYGVALWWSVRGRVDR